MGAVLVAVEVVPVPRDVPPEVFENSVENPVPEDPVEVEGLVPEVFP